MGVFGGVGDVSRGYQGVRGCGNLLLTGGFQGRILRRISNFGSLVWDRCLVSLFPTENHGTCEDGGVLDGRALGTAQPVRGRERLRQARQMMAGKFAVAQETARRGGHGTLPVACASQSRASACASASPSRASQSRFRDGLCPVAAYTPVKHSPLSLSLSLSLLV
jgi:hypothetical protein